MSDRWRNLALAAGTTALMLLVAELVVRTVTPHPISFTSNRLPDPELGHRMGGPSHEFDSRGFRNAQGAWAALNLIAIGDSHTYGFNVPSAQSWPQLVAARTGRDVYNLGVGGYGVLQYRVLLERAAEREPRAVLVALYPGNDLYDVCQARAEVDQPPPGLDTAGCPPLERPAPPSTLGSQLARHSGLVSLTRQIWRRLDNTLRAAPAGSIILNDPRIGGVIARERVAHHAAAMDLGRPDIAVGYRATLGLFDRLAELRQLGLPAAVLLIPTRPRVYRGALQKAGLELGPTYRDLCRREDELMAKLGAELDRRGIVYGSPLAGLQADLAAGRRVYPWRDDGHPTERGYERYADVGELLLNDLLSADQDLQSPPAPAAPRPSGAAAP